MRTTLMRTACSFFSTQQMKLRTIGSLRPFSNKKRQSETISALYFERIFLASPFTTSFLKSKEIFVPSFELLITEDYIERVRDFDDLPEGVISHKNVFRDNDDKGYRMPASRTQPVFDIKLPKKLVVELDRRADEREERLDPLGQWHEVKEGFYQNEEAIKAIVSKLWRTLF